MTVLLAVLLVLAVAAAVAALVAWRRTTGALAAEQARHRQVAAELAAVEAARTALEADLDAVRAERDDLQARLEAATEEVARLERARSGAEERAATLAAALVAAQSGGHDPDTLWTLEVARMQRRWREAVAPNPLDPPPDPGPDPLRFAVEIAAAALREEAGTAVTVDWLLDRLPPPAVRVTVLRVAEELLAAAAKVVEQATLAVGADGDDVLVVLAGVDEEGRRATPPVPVLADHAAVELAAGPGSVTARLRGALVDAAPAGEGSG